MQILSVDKDNLDKVYSFLKSLNIIKDLNEEVVLNGEYVFLDEIIGFLSFEKFNKIGLIRYFVFKKVVDQELIKDLFNKICIKAKAKNIDTLITLVVKEEAINVFKDLGFNITNKEDVFIDEINIENTRFKDALVLKYNLT